MALAVLGTGEALFAGAVGGFKRSFAANDDGDGDSVGGGRGNACLGGGLTESNSFAAGQSGAVGDGES